MRKNILMIAMLVVLATAPAFGQANTTFTGTVLSYGQGLSTRATTRYFTLDINRVTSDTDAQRFLGILQSRGQDALLDSIKTERAGRFMLGARLGRDVNVIRVHDVDGKKRILAVFERWLEVGEIRGGYRSLDYPFSYIEIFVDPVTGKAEGTYFAAAKIRWKGKDVEVEDFATLPSKLLNVRMKPGSQLP